MQNNIQFQGKKHFDGTRQFFALKGDHPLRQFFFKSR